MPNYNIPSEFRAYPIPPDRGSVTSCPPVSGDSGGDNPGGSTLPDDPPSLPAATDLEANRIVAISDNNQYVYASNADQALVYAVIGVTERAIPAGVTFQPRRTLIVTNPAWAWDATIPVFLGTSGLPTQTLPEAGNYLLSAGDAVTPTTVAFAFGTPILLG